MSSMYYRVNPAQAQTTTFGFRKVEERELTDILRRVTRPTYATRVQREEPKTLHNFRFSPDCRQRTPSACAKRPTSGTPRPKSPRRWTDRELQRLVRRLQKPTLSFEAATAALYNEELVFLDENCYSNPPPPSRARSADDRAKAFAKLTQSTAASRNKHVFYEQARKLEREKNEKNKKKPWELPPTPLYTLGDEGSSEKEEGEEEGEEDSDHEYEGICWERAASPVEVEAITDRLRVPTVASERGFAWCRRSPHRLDEVAMRRKVPLVSGLARTRRVEEISRRLHEGGSPRRGVRPEATRICFV